MSGPCEVVVQLVRGWHRARALLPLVLSTQTSDFAWPALVSRVPTPFDGPSES